MPPFKPKAAQRHTATHSSHYTACFAMLFCLLGAAGRRLPGAVAAGAVVPPAAVACCSSTVLAADRPLSTAAAAWANTVRPVPWQRQHLHGIHTGLLGLLSCVCNIKVIKRNGRRNVGVAMVTAVAVVCACVCSRMEKKLLKPHAAAIIWAARWAFHARVVHTLCGWGSLDCSGPPPTCWDSLLVRLAAA